jgi:16S rRNA processing protein RimM
LLALGTIGRAHGVRGAVRVRCSPEHFAFLKTLPELFLNGKPHRVTEVRGVAADAIVTIDGIVTRNDAEALNGAVIEVDRTLLSPPGEDEYFIADLEGCEVFATGGALFGVAQRVDVLPANAVITVKRADGGKDLLVPLIHDAVPVVDVAGRRLEIDLDFLGEGDAGE